MTEREFLERTQAFLSVDPFGRVWRSAVRRGKRLMRLACPKRADYFCCAEQYLGLTVTFPGRVSVKKYAHRLSFVFHNGIDIPAGKEVHHLDGNRANNSPDNLTLVTRRDNMNFVNAR